MASSDQSRNGEDEKKSVVRDDQAGKLEDTVQRHGELPPDPDEGLSDEEKARIVGTLLFFKL